jgi:hypothetical protein
MNRIRTTVIKYIINDMLDLPTKKTIKTIKYYTPIIHFEFDKSQYLADLIKLNYAEQFKLEYPELRKIHMESSIFSDAAFYGNQDILEFLLMRDCEIDHTAFLAAIWNNQIITLQWLIDIGAPKPSDPIEAAETFGSYESKKLLIENGFVSIQ